MSPGPNKYQVKKLKCNTPEFTLKGKANKHEFDPPKEIKERPSPLSYKIMENHTTKKRFSQIGIGYGSKMLGHFSLTKRQNTPGPGHYSDALST